MPIKGLSKLRFDEEFKAKPGPDNNIRIGSNQAAPRLVSTTKKFQPALEKLENDLEDIRNDKNLSEAGKQAKRAERISAHHLESQALKTDANTHAEALHSEVETIHSKTRNRFAPADPGEKFEAVELRNVLRSMPAEERGAVIRKALAEKDPAVLKALANLPSWDTTIVSSAPMKAMIADTIRNAELEALDPAERVAIENAATLAEIAGRKLAAFDTEEQRIIQEVR